MPINVSALSVTGKQINWKVGIVTKSDRCISMICKTTTIGHLDEGDTRSRKAKSTSCGWYV